MPRHIASGVGKASVASTTWIMASPTTADPFTSSINPAAVVMLSRKTMWAEIRRKALEKAGAKKATVAAAVAAEGRLPLKAAAKTIRVRRSQVRTSVAGGSKLRGRCRKAEDDDLLPALSRFVDERPTYGYRRI